MKAYYQVDAAGDAAPLRMYEVVLQRANGDNHLRHFEREQPVAGSKHSIASHERRVKRLAVRFGLSVMTMQKPIGKALAHGGYRLRDDATNKIVFGNEGYEFSADLDEVEAFLLRLKDPHGQP